MKKVLSLLALSFVLGTSVALANTPALPAGTAPEAAATAGQGAGAAAPQQPSLLGMALPLVLMFGVMYFLMIRPQQKKMKEQQNMINALQEGDEVVTAAGILGKISGLAEKVVILEVSPNVKIKVLKGQIAQVVKGPIKELA